MKAAIYCRISKDRKIDGTHTMLGVERQEEDCRELCASLGWEVVEVFVDNDVSATNGKPRPGYKAMLAAIEADTVDSIVCWHPDRLYRRTMDLEALVDVCDRHRTPIATVNAGAIDLTTPSGRLIARLLGATARYEGEHKAERWRASWQQRRKAGNPPTSGWRCFGYTRDGEVVPEEALALNTVVDYLLTGGTLQQACRSLNAEGFTTTRGNPWQNTPLRNTIVNPRYIGWVTYKGQPVARSDWPAILDVEKHEAIKALLGARRGRQPAPRKATLLGLAVCGVCGADLVTGGRRYNVRTYRCDVRGVTDRDCVTVTAEPVEKIVEAYAQARLSDPRVREAIARARETGAGTKIAQELATLEARLVALNAALADVSQPVPEVLAAITEVKARMAEAEGRLASVQPVPVAPELQWPADVLRRRALIGLVVERVTIDPVPGDEAGRFMPDRIRITPRHNE